MLLATLHTKSWDWDRLNVLWDRLDLTLISKVTEMFLNKTNVVYRFTSNIINVNKLCFRACSSDIPEFDMENPFEKEKEQCILCKYNIQVDYKNVKLLSQFQSPYTGRVYGKHITALCTKQQELVEKEIIKAQSAGLMATYLKEPCYLKDPQLFDVEKPIRSHRY